MGGSFGLIWLLSVTFYVVICVIFLVAAWRAMRAHESIAHSLQRIADKQERDG